MISKIKNMYWCFTKAGFKTTSAYKSDLIGYFIGESLYNIVLIFVWRCVFLYGGESTHKGFTLAEITLYLLLSGIVSFMDETDSIFILGEEIRDGSIIMRLVKPISLDKSILFYELGNKILMLFCVFIPSIVCVSGYVWFVYKASFPISSYLLFFVSLSLSYLLSFYFNLIFGFLSFYLLNLWGVSMMKTAIVKFFSGQVIPLFLFSPIIEKIFSVLPMASMTYTPVMLFLGKYTSIQIVYNLGVQLFWLVFFYVACQIVWRTVQNKLMIQGG